MCDLFHSCFCCDLDLPILPGAGAGVLVGSLIHKTTMVYPEQGTRASLAPVISRHAVGVRASLGW